MEGHEGRCQFVPGLTPGRIGAHLKLGNFHSALLGRIRPVSTPADKTAFFESNRNLFYVACSRPKVRLALLFTQILSANAMAKLTAWFGAANIVALPAAPEIPQG